MLAYDTARLEPTVLRKACDLLATRVRFLPFAAEIFAAAEEILEARRAKVVAEHADKAPRAGRTYSPIADQLRQQNIALEQQGRSIRWILRAGRPEMVETRQMSEPTHLFPEPHPIYNPRAEMGGNVTVPFWSIEKSGWIYPRTPNGLTGELL